MNIPPSPPPIIIPPPPPPPPPMPDIGSLQALEAQRAALAAQMRTGRLSTDLTDDGLLRRGQPLGRARPNNLGPAGRAPGGARGTAPSVSNPAAPLYTGALLGSGSRSAGL